MKPRKNNSNQYQDGPLESGFDNNTPMFPFFSSRRTNLGKDEASQYCSALRYLSRKLYSRLRAVAM